MSTELHSSANYCFTPPSVVSLPVGGSSQRFPVGRVFCVGRNYADHAREMGRDPDTEPPFFFMKPASAVLPLSGGEGRIAMPRETDNYHYEVELVVALGKPVRQAAPEQALDAVWGYAVGLDMTRRDLQLAARNAGRPWEFGKSFSPSAPIGPIRQCVNSAAIDGELSLMVNGVRKQFTTLDKMIWSVAECISYLSRFEDLLPGDLIMTGTPAGVGPVVPGDLMEAHMTGLHPICVRVA